MSLRGPCQLFPTWEHSVHVEEDYVSPWKAAWLGQCWRYHFVLEDNFDWVFVPLDPRLDPLGGDQRSAAPDKGSDPGCAEKVSHRDEAHMVPVSDEALRSAKDGLRSGASMQSCLARRQGRKAGLHVQISDVDVQSKVEHVDSCVERCATQPRIGEMEPGDLDSSASVSRMSTDSLQCGPVAVHLQNFLKFPPTESVDELQLLLELAKGPWWDFWQRGVEPLSLSREMWEYLQNSPLPIGVPLSFCIFVDGSAEKSNAGWGLVLFAWNGFSWAYLGWAGDGLQNSGGTNNDAECQGLLIALAWCMSLPAQVHVDIVVDSTFARDCAMGHIGVQTCDRESPAVKVRLVKQWLERWHRSVLIHWTPSHKGTFGNEFADRVAAFCSRRGHTGASVPSCVGQLLSHPLLAWAWAATHKVPGLVRLRQLQEGVYETSDRIPGECIEAILDDVRPRSVSRAVLVHLRLCTANVCSLRNKCAVLKRQCSEARVAVVALQETRLGSDSSFLSDGWVIVQTAAKGGQDGCAVWFNVEVWNEELEIDNFGLQQVCVLDARHDWLVVRVSCGNFDAIFVTFRAPHSLKPDAEIRDWWQTATRSMNVLKSKASLFILGDCNAQVTYGGDGVVGSLAVAEENLAGQLLVGLCQDVDVALVNTFPSAAFPIKMKNTWRDRCIDYVAVPRSLLIGAEVCNIDIDLCNPHDDHEALCVDVKLPCKVGTPDSFAHAGVGSVRRESSKWKCVKNPSWNCNVHRHAEHIFDEAKRHQKARISLRPQKPYVSSGTWDLVCQKKASLCSRRRCLQECGKAILRGFLRAWRESACGDSRFQGPSGSLVPVGWWRLRFIKVFARIRNISRTLMSALRRDKRAYIENVLQGARDAIETGDTKKLWHDLRFFRKGGKVNKVFKALPFLLDADGNNAGDLQEQTCIKAKHFGSMEAAVPCNASQAVQMQMCEFQDRDVRYRMCDLPTLYDVEQALVKLSRGKAPGPSGVRNEYWLEDPVGSAKKWFPVTLKTHLRLCEPARLAVGLLHCLYKGKGLMCQVENWRSIFLMEGVGKACRKISRPPLVAHLVRQSSSMMQGCKPGSCSAALTHYAITWLKVHKAKGNSAGLLFLDWRSAFYRVLRSRLLGGCWTDEAICDVLHQMKVDPLLFQEILNWSKGPSLLEGVSGHVARVVRAFFRFSAFIFPADSTVYVSRSGTRPGDSLADVVFALVMADAMAEVEDELRAVCPNMYDNLELCPSHPVWADDACFPFWEAGADKLEEKAALVARVVHVVCCRRALEPNYGLEKTECMLIHGGSGAKQARRHVFAGSGKLTFEAFGVRQQVRVTSAYTHLGTTITDDLGACCDVRRKIAKGLGLVRPLASKVLRREDVPLAKRAEICNALGPTAAGFNCAVWGHFPKDVMKRWVRGHENMYRMLLKEDRHTQAPKHPTVYEVCGATGLPVPQARLSIARIMHARRLVALDLDQLWSMLELEEQLVEESWLRTLRMDLAWLQYWCSSLSGMSFETVDTDELAVWISEHNLDMLVKRAWRRQTQTLRDWAEWQLHQRGLGAMTGVRAPGPTVSGSTCVECPLCDFVADSGSQLAGHIGSVHAHVNLAWRYMQSATCRICLKHFWVPKRLLAHLNSGNGCLAQAVVALEPAFEGCLAHVDDEVGHDERRDFRRAPAVRKAGPLRRRPANFIESLSLHIHTASSLDLRAVCKSARFFSHECELLESLIEAVEPTPLNRSGLQPPPINPDGRVWLQKGFQSFP